jgi:deoxyadenosine/deoxycytidine kinase
MNSPGQHDNCKRERIEICGGIASGKTTLAQLLSGLDIIPVFEDFQTNPFWKAFYADPIGTAFETEISFLLQHYHDIKSAIWRGKPFVCDFSLALDLAYAHVTLSGGKRAAFESVFREIREELPPPSLVVHLVCSPNVELDRIRKRARDIERSITLEYLEAINQALVNVLKEDIGISEVLTFDSAAINFADDEEGKRWVIKAVGEKLGHAYTGKVRPAAKVGADALGPVK